ncbi:helix-turn-helix domain-containing protein [Leptospira sp. 96542]|nr:helix-turn-helix domain-containing protein [Leptospira sp. 96542]
MWDLICKLIGFSAGLSFLFALGEFLRKGASYHTYLQGFLFLFAAFFQAHTYLAFSGEILSFPHLYLFHLPFTAFFGALLKRYFFVLWSDPKETLPFTLWDFIPPVLVFLLLIPFYMEPKEVKIAIHSAYPKEGVPNLYKFIIVLAVLPILYSGVYVFRQVFRYVRWVRLKESAHLRLVVFVVSVGTFGSLLGIFTLFLHVERGLEMVSFLIALLIIFVYLLRQKSPELWGEFQRIVIEEKKYQISQLRSFDLELLGNKLKDLMETQKIHRDETLNLESMANYMGLTEHQMSELLNTHIGKSFFHFVNHYRIEEAKEIFRKNPKLNILNVVYEVGFPSKSTFYDAFKREVGMSPSDFRKKFKIDSD